MSKGHSDANSNISSQVIDDQPIPVRKHRDPTVGILLIIFIIGFGAVTLQLFNNQSDLIQTTALRNAEHYSKTLETFRSLYTSEVVVRAKKAGLQVTHDYKKSHNAIPLPATFSMQLGNELSKDGDTQTKLYSPYPFPWRKETGGLNDDFSTKAWAALNENPDQPYYQFENVNGISTLRYAVADRMLQSCVNCHNAHPDTPKSDWELGQVRGVLEVDYPMAQIATQANTQLQTTLILLVIIAGIALIVFAYFAKKMRVNHQDITNSHAELEIVNLQLKLQSVEAENANQHMLDAYEKMEQTNKNLFSQATELKDARHASFNIMQDITEANKLIDLQNKDMEIALQQIQSQQATLDEHAIVSICDVKGDITYVNDKLVEISGYSREEAIGQKHSIFSSGNHSHEFFREMWKTVVSGETWQGEIKNQAKDGSYYWVLSTIVPFKDEDGSIIQYVAIRTDITKGKQQELHLERMTTAISEGLDRERESSTKLATVNKKLTQLASTDKLTGLPNRAVFLEKLTRLLDQSKQDDSKFAVLFFDFDRFKVVNDSLGHDIGDALLCQIAEIYTKELRRSDLVARFGGDEFVVILGDLTDWDNADQIAQKLLKAFAEPHHIDGHRVVSTASIGLVTNEFDYETPNDMIRDADAAMYQAKDSGKAKVVVFDKKMHDDALDRLVLEADLRHAIENDELRLVYQPIVELASGEITGFEALIRWQHPTRGVVSPVDFIPIAEETGMIVEIGNWVIHTASKQIKDWNNRLNLDRMLTVNVNVSKRQLLGDAFVSEVIQIKEQYDLKPGEIKIEITESIIADDRIDIVSLLNELREQGFPIVMDDFGTGVSSLGTLHNYPIDVLKIDQAFIRVLDRDRSLLAVVASITNLAENLGILTVAEGIESNDIVGALQSINCTWGQGYYFAKPLSVADAEAYILGMHQSAQVG